MTSTPSDVLRNLRRLAQVATLAERRWQLHEARCERCQDEDEDDELLCAEGLSLYTLATAYRCAVLTVRGQMVWQ